MKLVSLYIENFGGLHQYRLDFAEGLTVVQEPNGFGKTTLAEFIRAMFYGFPRKSKDLGKSKRQKYAPWNGGKFSGSLTFRLSDGCYRVERTFGLTPRGDTFALIDLETGKKSSRFSEEIGEELFQLDADSFARSTYLPQQHDAGSLTTDSIRAKLGDLVEDTNDVGNFEKAVNALRAKRSAILPYRGNGGTVAEATEKISRLQKKLDEMEDKREALSRCQEAITQLEAQYRQSTQARARTREEMVWASEAAAAAAARHHLESLSQHHRREQEALHALEAQYPKGFPEIEELDTACQAAERASLLEEKTVTEQEDLDAAAFLEANRGRFEAHIPSAPELEACRSWCQEALTKRAEAERAGLLPEEKKRYEELLALEKQGALSEERLARAGDANRELVKLRHEWENLDFSRDEQQRLAELKDYFSAGVPGEETIFARQRDLAEIEELRQKTERLAPQPRIRKPGSLFPVLALLLLMAAGITLGILLLAWQEAVMGAVCLGVGILALVGAVFLGMKRMVSREVAGTARWEQEDNATARLAALERDVRNFTSRYTSAQPLSEALREIQRNREELRTLSLRQQKMAERREELGGRIREEEAFLERELGSGDFEQTILKRHLEREQLQTLRAKARSEREKKEKLLEQSRQREAQTAEFLAGYFPNPQPEDFKTLLTALQRDSEAYTAAWNRVKQWENRKSAHARDLASARAARDAFLEDYGLKEAGNEKARLMQLREDRKAYLDAQARLAELTGEIARFRTEHEKELSRAAGDSPANLEELTGREAKLTSELEALTRELLEQRQRAGKLREEIDAIPALRDELEQWQTEKSTGMENARVLDETVSFLEKARENLALSYLGPIRRSLADYLGRLTGEDGEKILVTPDLEVKLERQGQARDLAFFSAGQKDVVMLCMRLALVDALFTREKPFMILDDPFVNLDDRHTAEALELLRQIARERQMVYLVCNSSRSL